MKKIVCLSLCLAFVLSGCSFLGGNYLNAKDKTFSKAGMSIVLTDKFSEKEMVSYTATYDSQRVAVLTLKEEFDLAEGASDLTLDEYAQFVLDNNNLEADIKTKGGLVTFEYDKQVSGKHIQYFAAVYKASDAFWLVQFGCEADQYEELSDLILKWAKSVTFED